MRLAVPNSCLTFLVAASFLALYANSALRVMCAKLLAVQHYAITRGKMMQFATEIKLQ